MIQGSQSEPLRRVRVACKPGDIAPVLLFYSPPEIERISFSRGL